MNNTILNSSTCFRLCIWILIIGINGCHEEFPPAESEIGQIFLNSAYDLQIADGHAFVTTNDGLVIIDISNPVNPVKSSTYETSEAAFGILVESKHAFVGSAGERNLSILDVADPHHPILLSELGIPGTIYDIEKQSDILFISTWEGGFHIVEASNLNEPHILSSLDCQGHGTGLAVCNEVVYYANANKGLQIIDISEKGSPAIIESVAGSQTAWDLHAIDSFLYLGKHNGGFNIFQIEPDHSLTHIGSGGDGGEVYGIWQHADIIYIADLVDGVERWDISDKSHPELLQTIPEYAPHDITYSDGKVFLADQDRHFVILDI